MIKLKKEQNNKKASVLKEKAISEIKKLLEILREPETYEIKEFETLKNIELFYKNNKKKIEYNEKELRKNIKGKHKGFITKEIKLFRQRIRQVWDKEEIKNILKMDNDTRYNVIYPCYTDIKKPSTLVFLVKIIN